MVFTIGTISFILKNMPDYWFQSDAGHRLDHFKSKAACKTSFQFELTDTLTHPPQSFFKEKGNVSYFYDYQTDLHYFITAEMRSCIDWPAKKMILKPLPAIADSDSDITAFLFIHLRLFTSLIAIRQGGIPLHSSAVYTGDNALIFFGTSGAGKTTVAQMMRTHGWILLNDEYNLIMPSGKQYRVYGTPFTRREINLIQNVPDGKHITALLSLNRGDFHITIPSPAEATRLILKSVYLFPDYSTIAEALLDNAAAVSAKIPLHELYFKKNDATATLLQKKYAEVNHE